MTERDPAEMSKEEEAKLDAMARDRLGESARMIIECGDVLNWFAGSWRKIIAGEEKRDLATVSPLQQAARLKVPLMIVHGELDHNVPIDQSKKMEAALRKTGTAVEAIYYPGEGHGIVSKENLTDLLSRLEHFLGRHNPP